MFSLNNLNTPLLNNIHFHRDLQAEPNPHLLSQVSHFV